MDVRLPDGTIIQNIPDGTTKADLTAKLSRNGYDVSKLAEAPTAQEAPPRSPIAQVGRTLGLAARMPLQAAGGTVGMVGDALNAGVNALGGAIGHNPNLQMPSRMIQAGIDRLLPVPETTGEKVGDFVGTVAAGGLRGGVDPLARAITSRFAPATSAPLANALAERQKALLAGQQAGYKVPPSEMQGGPIGTLVEGLAGKTALQTKMSVKNQNVTDTLARKVVGLEPHQPITEEAINAAKRATYDAGYEPIKQVGTITTGGVYRRALDKVLTDFQGASGSFPAAAKDDVRKLVNAYRVPSFNSADAIDAIKNLRQDASSSFQTGNPNLGQAQRAISHALENNIELNLNAMGAQGKTMLSNFREARKTLAQQNVVSDALERSTGEVNAKRIAAQMQRKGEGYMTDDLKTIAAFAKNAPKVSGIPAAQSAPRTPIFPLAATALFGGPKAVLATLGMPILKEGLRQGIMSKPGQAMIRPNIMSNILKDPQLMNALPTLLQQSGLFAP